MQQEIEIKLICTQFPGLQFGPYHPVYVGLQKQDEICEAVPANVQQKDFLFNLRVEEDKHGNPNFLGPYVFGKTGDKFLYLVWFVKRGEGEERFRRAKIKLNHLSWAQIHEAVNHKRALVAQVKMTDQKGGPVCASLKGEQVSWEG